MYTPVKSSSLRSQYDLNYSRDESYKYSMNTTQYSTASSSPGSPLKVSELNPDGSVTIRNLQMYDDDTWTKNEDLVNAQRRERHLRREYLANAGGVNFERETRPQILLDNVPGTRQVDPSDPSEAVAHQLRRQRLAQTSLLSDSPSTSTSGSRSSKRAQHDGRNYDITLSPGPFNGSRMMNTTTYSPTYSPTNFSTPASRQSHGSKKSRSRHKHVVFSEPLTPPRFQPTEKPRERLTEEPGSSPKVINSSNYGYIHHTTLSKPIMDIYSDLDSAESKKVNRSFSSGDSSIFADVPQMSNNLENTYVRTKARNKISYADSDTERRIPNLYSVTVTKASQSDRIGMFVHRENFAGGHRLVVSKVAPDGKFAGTKIKQGDVLVSINGVDMTTNPSLERALSIVTSAVGSVTVVVHENIDVNDSQSEINDSASGSVAQTTVSSISKDQSSFYSPRDGGNEALRAKTAAKTGTMTMDGSLLVTKNSEIGGSVSIKINESWKVSGVMVINIETNSSELEDPGLRFGTKKTSSGYVTFIADISPASVFQKTPLKLGDTIVSINKVNFFNNPDIFDAYAALWKSEKRITLVAKRGEESLKEFLRGQAGVPRSKSLNESFDTALTVQTSGTMGTAASGAKSLSSNTSDDRNLSGSSQSSRTRETPSGDSNTTSESNDLDEESNSSRRIKIRKNRHEEFIGLELSEVTTAWGKLLSVKKIMPGSKAAASELKVGDVVLTINGISFRNNPDASSAISLLRKSQKEVCIEFQRFSSLSKKVQDDLQKSLNITGDSELLGNSLISHEVNESKQKVPKKRQKVLVTVTKSRQGQKIGLDFAMLNHKLVVTDISPKGLLRNAPLVYGDTILSINGVRFDNDPVAKEAYDLVKNAPKKVTLEILKVEYAPRKPDNIGVATKSCIPGPLLCGRRKKVDPEQIPAIQL